VGFITRAGITVVALAVGLGGVSVLAPNTFALAREYSAGVWLRDLMNGGAERGAQIIEQTVEEADLDTSVLFDTGIEVHARTIPGAKLPTSGACGVWGTAIALDLGRAGIALPCIVSGYEIVGAL